MTTTANPPIERISMGAIPAAIWRNVSDKNVVRYGVSFERTYRDANGDSKSSKYYGRDECLLLVKVADRAHTRIVELIDEDRARDRKAREGQPAEAGSPAPATAHEGR